MHNDEINAVILGRNFAKQMDAMFADDLAQTVQITAAQWSHRPLRQRLQEKMARVVEYWM